MSRPAGSTRTGRQERRLAHDDEGHHLVGPAQLRPECLREWCGHEQEVILVPDGTEYPEIPVLGGRVTAP
jgi:hypothetical protein